MPGAKPQSSERQSASLGQRKLQAMVMSMQETGQLGGALLAFLGALFLLLAFPFFPVYLAPLIAVVPAAIAWFKPPFGVLAGLLLAWPAIAYQSPVFSWLFLAIIAVTLFEMFEFWSIIAMLEVLVLAPFAPFPFSLLAGLTFLGAALAALYVGSSRSVLVSVPAVFLVLLLTTLWLTPNNAFLPTRDLAAVYGPAEDALARDSSPYLSLAEIPAGISGAVAGALSIDNLRFINAAIGKTFNNAVILLTQDSAVFQLSVWAIVLYLIGYIPGVFKNRYKQTIACLLLLLIPASNLVLGPLFGQHVDLVGAFVFVGLSMLAVGLLEHFNIKVSREQFIKRQERTKSFSKFGLQDLADSEGADTLDDVGGYEDVKGELRESIMLPLEKKDIALAYNIKPPSGIMLFGPPGTGKTLLMRALAKDLGFGFYYVKSSELLSQWYGESEKNISELFTIARKHAPCVLFFDEIDSIGKRRDSYTSDDVGPRLLSLFLEELDGFKDKSKVIVIGATNIPNQLDPALLRPGRFDKVIYMHLPDKPARLQIFKVHLKKAPSSLLPADLDKLAARTERYSGADIANICVEAVRAAAQKAAATGRLEPVTIAQVNDVLSRVRPSVSLAALEEYDQFKLDFERRSAAPQPEEDKDTPHVKWTDVAGLDDVKRTLLEAIEIPLLHEDLMKEYKLKPSKGLLMYGPPGCGKTLLARAAANELKVTFLTLSGADLNKKGPQYGVRLLKEAFNRAREQAPSIVFIDEIETVASSRDAFGANTIGQLLIEMDGIKELKNVMVIGATNKPWFLDAAILRPGRFDKIVYISPPDPPAREQLLRNQLAGLQGAPTLDYATLAKTTEGYSGADLAAVCQETKMTLVRDKLAGKPRPVTTQLLLASIKNRPQSITPRALKEYQNFAHRHETGQDDDGQQGIYR